MPVFGTCNHTLIIFFLPAFPNFAPTLIGSLKKMARNKNRIILGEHLCLSILYYIVVFSTLHEFLDLTRKVNKSISYPHKSGFTKATSYGK